MAKLLKLRRGTTSQHSSFTGAEGEVTVDTDKESLVVHNGSTAGGFPIARADGTGVSNFTITGELDAATLDISGNADIDGTLEADAYTVDGTALNEYIADTVGAMVGSNTETGIAVTYEDSDNTLDFAITSIPGVTFTGDVTFDNGTNTRKDINSDESDDALEFADSTKAVFGSDSDLAIYHDASHSRIKTASGATGNLVIDSNNDINLRVNDSEMSVHCKENAGVELYYDNVLKFETKSYGAYVTGDLHATSDIRAQTDNGEVSVGASDDLKMLHDGTGSIIENSTGNLAIRGKTGENHIVMVPDSKTALYYDAVKTFETIANGIVVTGTEAAASYIYLHADEGDDNADKWNINADTGGDFKVQSYSGGSWQDELVLTNAGNLTATGNVTAYSDARLKTDVDTIENALDKVTKLRGVSFTKVDTDERGIGVIAQEIEEILPEVVQEGAYKSVAYGNIVGLLIEAIKELKAQVDEHKVTCEAEHNHGGN